MRTKLIFLLALLPGVASAQVDSLEKRMKYYNSFVSGVMIGSSEDADEKEFSMSFLTTHGIKFNSGLKLGIGIGLDTYYYLKVFPMLLSLTFDQERRKHGLFVQLNGGYSLVRHARDSEVEGITIDEMGGFVINPMIGYRIKVENIRLYVQAGYKYQQAVLHYDYPHWWGLSHASREYDLNRFVVQIGFGFE